MAVRPTWNALLERWYGVLGLPRQPLSSWHRSRIREELHERRKAISCQQKLSETSDVFFSINRARHDGFPNRKLPVISSRHILVYAYMLAKFTLRWKFYRITAFFCNDPRYKDVREVVNPRKDQKLEEVALRNQINPAKFKYVGRRLRRVWPLLP